MTREELLALIAEVQARRSELDTDIFQILKDL